MRARSAPGYRPRVTSPQGVLPRLAGACARRAVLGRQSRFCGAFWTSEKFLTAQPYRACKGPASHANEEPASVAIGTAAAIVRANLTGPATASRRCRFIPRFTRIVRMLITPAFAQAAGGGDTNSMLMSLLPFALIFVIMYFLILRPQQKKVKDHAELVKNIRRGDTVIRSEEHTSELQSLTNLVCRLLLEKKKKKKDQTII